jgi:Ser/Thr protein kinase RdoA (MazF antagonist)
MFENGIESILKKYGIEHIFDITDLKEQRGWSSKKLYKITTPEQELLLKAKSRDQIKGFHTAIRVTDYLNKNQIPTRKALKTTENKYFVRDNKGLIWILSTYIPGETYKRAEYTPKTFQTLAVYMSKYLSLTLNKKELIKQLDLEDIEFEMLLNKKREIKKHKKLLKKVLPKETKKFNLFLKSFKKSLRKGKYSTLNKAIIHGDISDKNIIMDPNTKDTVAAIDWDHSIFNYALKDIVYTLFIARSFKDSRKCEECEKEFIKVLKDKLDLHYDLLEELYFVYATNFLWDTILFNANLIAKLGDTTGEEEKFTNNMRVEAREWNILTNS